MFQSRPEEHRAVRQCETRPQWRRRVPSKHLLHQCNRRSRRPRTTYPVQHRLKFQTVLKNRHHKSYQHRNDVRYPIFFKSLSCLLTFPKPYLLRGRQSSVCWQRCVMHDVGLVQCTYPLPQPRAPQPVISSPAPVMDQTVQLVAKISPDREDKRASPALAPHASGSATDLAVFF